MFECEYKINKRQVDTKRMMSAKFGIITANANIIFASEIDALPIWYQLSALLSFYLRRNVKERNGKKNESNIHTDIYRS